MTLKNTENSLDQASQILANARVECLKLGVEPYYISRIMLDEAVLGLIATGLHLSEIQTVLKKYGKRDLVKFYRDIYNAAEHTEN